MKMKYKYLSQYPISNIVNQISILFSINGLLYELKYDFSVNRYTYDYDLKIASSSKGKINI